MALERTIFYWFNAYPKVDDGKHVGVHGRTLGCGN